MKKIKSILLILSGICLLNSSCNDWLSVLPENEQASETYWSSKEELESVLAAGYVYLRDAVPELINWAELRGSNIYAAISTNSIHDLQNFQLQSSKNYAKWGSLYKVINMANSVLDNAQDVLDRDPTLNETVMRSYMTEAYFLRALSYFYIVRNWGEAPLILKPYVDDAIKYEIAKSTEDVIVAQIKDDIRTALATGTAKESFESQWANKGRATKWALHALLADVSLWSEEYSQVIMSCNEILDATSGVRPVFMLGNSDDTKWFTMFFPGNSNESIFELQYDQQNYSQSNNLATLFGNSTPTYYYTGQMLFDLIRETDLTGVNNAVRSLYGAFLPNTTGAQYADATQGYIWKYTGIGEADQIRPANAQDPNFIVYRVAEIMLMKAEALVLRNSDTTAWKEAVDLINQIRTRSRLPVIDPELSEVSETDLLQYILDERKMEFAAEGKRWYDLLRLGKCKNYQYKDKFLIDEVVRYNNSANSSWIRSVLRDNNACYLPIHDDELKNNPSLVQNPYYDIIK